VNCPQCGKELPDSDTFCKDCGKWASTLNLENTYKPSLILVFGGGFIVFLILLIFIAAITGNMKEHGSVSAKKTRKSEVRQPTEKKERDVVYNSGWDASVYQVEDYLKQNLKDPESLECIEWSEVQKNDYGFMVRCKYRAKNSFGGYVVNNQLFYLDKKGKVFNVKEWK